MRRFSMSEVRFSAKEGGGPMLVIIGRRGTGKSVLVRDLLHFFQDLPRGMVVDGTESGNHFYEQFLPAECIQSEFSLGLMETLFRRQQHVVQSKYDDALAAAAKKGKGDEEQNNLADDNRMFLVLDNCMYVSTWSRDKLMRSMFMNARFWKILIVVTMGYPLDVPPILRSNIDFAFLLYAPTIGERKRLYDYYGSTFPSFEAFNMVFEQVATGHGCMVVCNRSNASSPPRQIEDVVKFYQAPIWPAFHMSACAPP